MNRDPHRPARARDALGQCAHAAAHVAPDAAHTVTRAHHVMEQDIRGARLRRRGVGADHRIRGQRDFQLLAVEPFVEQVGSRSGQHAHKIRPLVFQAGSVADGVGSIGPEIREAEVAWIRRDHRHHWLEHRGDLADRGFVAGVIPGVPGGELRDLPVYQDRIRPEHQMPPIGERREARWIAGQHLEPVLLQFEVPYDPGLEQTIDVRAARHLVARPQFLGHRGPANHRPRLEDGGPDAGLRQIGGRHQSVVARADHNRVIGALAHRASIL